MPDRYHPPQPARRSDLTPRGGTHRWRERRKWWAARLPLPCVRCGQTINPGDRWHLDHIDPASLGGRDADARPAHAGCNLAAGNRSRVAKVDEPDELEGARFVGQRATASQAALTRVPPPDGIPPAPDPTPSPPASPETGLERPRTPDTEPDGYGALDPVWRRCPWITPLLAIPPDASWPRLMSGPHPDAAGSYGAEFCAWTAARTGTPLRWWQQLAAYRLLEHDRAGTLVWPWWLLSTARQVGKSWLLRELLLWRLGAAATFGEPQLVLHTGKDLPVCREVQRPARAWARTQTGWVVRETNGMEEIEAPDGGRWLIRGRGSVYGYSASLGAVDEAWKVAPEIVEDGLEPTMAERASPQLGLLSTAHRMATPLMPTRRTAALGQLAEPVDTLLIEWSAHPDGDLGDRTGWRQASPHWSDRRARLIEAQYTRAMTGGRSEDPDEPDPVESFRAQWLNIWARPAMDTEAGAAWVDEEAWDAAARPELEPAGPLVLAADDAYGRAVGVVAVARIDARTVLVWGEPFDRRDAGAAWAAHQLERHPGSRLVLSPALADDPAFSPLPAAQATGTLGLSRVGLSMLRSELPAGRIRHDGGLALTRQVLAARVAETTSGLQIVASPSRTDLLRALAWALPTAMKPAPPAPDRFRIR